MTLDDDTDEIKENSAYNTMIIPIMIDAKPPYFQKRVMNEAKVFLKEVAQ